MLVHHHVKYKEIHGVDEVVLMEKGEHKRLHARLRKEGKCNIPVPVLAQVSDKAYKRRDESRERYRERATKYRQDTAYREWNRERFAKRYAEDPAFRERERERQREHNAKRRTVFPRLRPDIISSAMTPD